MMWSMLRCGVAGALVAVVATAGVAAAGPLLVQDWHQLSTKERYDTLQNYWQHQRLPEQRQQDIEKRYERWRNLPPDQRDRVRQNYERFQQLSPEERQRFERKYDKWRQEAAPQQ